MPAREPESYLHGGSAPVVVVPARVAAWLYRTCDLDRHRIDVRGADAEISNVLVALKVAGLSWVASATGTQPATKAEAERTSTSVGTATAAQLLHITPRAVRLAIAEHRLTATQIDGRWTIAREDLEHYRQRRTP
ncbi:helix-turn-helix domain-containing protein [Herbiconiux gentiana]|uniref:helix-turn-helix domain-containing protein n=1 Tax=Herbiconiux gentiana TaxID=2970912 RepID=UPI0035C766D2